MERLSNNLRNTIFKKLESGELYFGSPIRVSKELKEMANVSKNFNPVKYNGDVVTVYDNTFGGVAYREDNFVSNPHEFVVVSKTMDSYYLYCCLDAHCFDHLMLGHSCKYIKKEDLESIQVKIPPLEEQIKIGQFMKLFDKKNDLERRIYVNI